MEALNAVPFQKLRKDLVMGIGDRTRSRQLLHLPTRRPCLRRSTPEKLVEGAWACRDTVLVRQCFSAVCVMAVNLPRLAMRQKSTLTRPIFNREDL